jgi:hypothetical protein
MRVFVMAHQRAPIPPHELPDVVRRLGEWWRRQRPAWESAYMFAGGQGCVGILNVPDESTVDQILLDWPLAAHWRIDVRPVVDVDTALAQWHDALAVTAGHSI